MTGYDLKRTLDNSTAHFWHAYHSQIYTTLRKLEQDNLVTSEVQDEDDKLNRRVYTITDAGRAELDRWLAQPMREIAPTKDELLVRLFFSAPRDKEAVLNELRFQRQLHQRQLEVYQGIDLQHFVDAMDARGTNVERDREFWQFTLNNGLAYEQMTLAWLDATIARIESMDD